MKMNQWQREILKLEKQSDKDLNRKLYNAYNDALKDVRKQLRAYMDEYEDLPYYKQQQAGKLSALEKEIVELLNGAYPKTKHEVTEFKRNELTDGYYSTMYQLEAETGARLDFMGLDTEFVRQTVSQPIAGKTLSNRLYKSRVKLANRATSELRTGMMQGKTYAEIAGAIKRHTEANYSQALRIARTEGGRLRSMAKQAAYSEAKEMGIVIQKSWYSSLDNRTRSSHQKLDGQTVEIDEDFISPESGAKGPMPRMLGKASEDIGCRCTTVTVVDGIAPGSRYAKDDSGHGYEKIEYKNYSEWAKARGVETKPKPKPMTEPKVKPKPKPKVEVKPKIVKPKQVEKPKPLTQQKTYTTKQLDQMSVNKLREKARQLSLEYHSSGMTGISYGGRTPEQVTDALMDVKRSKTALKKDILAMQRKLKQWKE